MREVLDTVSEIFYRKKKCKVFRFPGGLQLKALKENSFLKKLFFKPISIFKAKKEWKKRRRGEE